jgi:hypothetical protein
MSRLRASETRRKVYALLIEGKSQSSIAKTLGLSKASISDHALRLVKQEAISPIPGTRNPILYEKGPRGGELDALILGASKEVSKEFYARGVNPAPKNAAPLTEVKTAKVHHLKFRAEVIKEGDTQFLKPYFDRRGVTRSKGRVEWNGKKIAVEHETTAKLNRFYVHAPEMDLTADELESYEDRAAHVAQDILNHISKVHGWRFGFPELTNWQHHIAVESPATVGGLAEKFYMKSEDGKSWLSNSQGRPEHEFSDVEQAKIMLELPGEVLELRTTIKELHTDLAALVEVLTTAKTAIQQVAEIESIFVKSKAAETVTKVKMAEEQAEAVKAALKPLETPAEIGAMYQ